MGWVRLGCGGRWSEVGWGEVKRGEVEVKRGEVEAG